MVRPSAVMAIINHRVPKRRGGGAVAAVSWLMEFPFPGRVFWFLTLPWRGRVDALDEAQLRLRHRGGVIVHPQLIYTVLLVAHPTPALRADPRSSEARSDPSRGG